MATLHHQPIQLRFQSLPNLKPRLRSSATSGLSRSFIVCGLRRSDRKSLWRSRIVSGEAIQVVHSLKLAKSNEKIEHILNTRLSRLLKADVLDALAELQRQNQLQLVLKVFNFICEEEGYRTELSLYCDMIFLLGKNKLIDKAEEVFSALIRKGLKPNTRTYNEMIGAYIQVGMIDRAMELYKLMKTSGCIPDRLTFMILIRSLEKAGKQDVAATLKEECADYVDSHETFLEEVEKKYEKRRSPNLV